MNYTSLLAVLVFAALYTRVQADFMECQMCELTVKVAAPMLGQDTANIEKAVDDECKKEFHKIPFASQECRNFINAKLDPIIHELESGTAPKDVCRKLGMC
ncbi:unnamed protein product [Caenorhabditis bovis]|uniref:Saposin B-type domain-containing protein n=1 Tax=Caenorhabditis bovis TaxID=2654633 RepID=A0A8S1EII2_9PELO|nr:unnamed protein product [Caenorhabditis bovis]